MKELIRHLLSVAKVGTSTRQALRVALASGDQVALRSAGRTLVGSLLSRGDLVRVQVGGQDNGTSRHYALRGHSTLLDLSSLYTEDDAPAAAPPEPTPAHLRARTVQDDLFGPSEYDIHERVLNAMERAQDLNIARAAADGISVVLQDVLDLVRPTFDDVELHVELLKSADVTEALPNVDHCPRRDRPFWALTRLDGESVWIQNWSELPPFLRRRIPPEDDPWGYRGGVAVPLYPPRDLQGDHDDDGTGEVGLLYALPKTETDRETMIRLAFRISHFVTNGWRQTDLMTRLVHIDPLTGVHNRGFYEQQIVLEVERAQRRGSSLVLLLGDIDHFKAVNDRFGHPAGDRVLKSVARELLRGLRRIDLVCRVGGEEFALVLPDTDLEAAREIVTRIQVRIANLHLSDPDAAEPLRVTISFGGAGFPGAGDTPAELYRNADRMLYLSKQRGRNRCHFWNPLGDPVLTLPRYNAPSD